MKGERAKKGKKENRKKGMKLNYYGNNM